MQDLELSIFTDRLEIQWCWECGGSFYVRKSDYGKIVKCPWCFQKSLLSDGWPNGSREEAEDA